MNPFMTEELFAPGDDCSKPAVSWRPSASICELSQERQSWPRHSQAG